MSNFSSRSWVYMSWEPWHPRIPVYFAALWHHPELCLAPTSSLGSLLAFLACVHTLCKPAEIHGEQCGRLASSKHVFLFSGQNTLFGSSLFNLGKKKAQLCKIQLLYVCILPSFSLNDLSCCRRGLYTFNQMIDFIILVTWYPIIK